MTGYQGDPDLLTIPKAVKLLGISERTGYRLARAGEFPGGAALKVGRSWRVSLPRLRAHLYGSDVDFQTLPKTTGDDLIVADSVARVKHLVEALAAVLADPVIVDRLARSIFGE